MGRFVLLCWLAITRVALPAAVLLVLISWGCGYITRISLDYIAGEESGNHQSKLYLTSSRGRLALRIASQGRIREPSRSDLRPYGSKPVPIFRPETPGLSLRTSEPTEIVPAEADWHIVTWLTFHPDDVTFLEKLGIFRRAVESNEPRWEYRRSTFYCCPHWLIVLILLLANSRLLYIVAMRWRARRRYAAHCCPACGYDMRATPLRCPECGLEAAVG